MTVLADYNDVVAEAQDWLFGRPDIAAKVPTFIRLAEAKGNRTLFCRQMEGRATATVQVNSVEPEFISLPVDFQSMRRIRLKDVQGKPRLRFATGPQMDDLRERDGNTPGTPIWFSLFGNEIELCPTPNTANVLEMVYRKTIPPLTVDSPTNWLLQEAPDFYLYGTLLEVAPYLHEDERIPMWAAGVKGAIDGLNKLSEEALYNAGPLTIRRKGRPY